MLLSQKFRDTVYASPLYRASLKGRAPEGLRPLPPDPWAGDPRNGLGIRHGVFPLGPALIDAGNSPWDAPAVRGRALEALHSFAWMRDLRADPAPPAKDRARFLVDDWINRFGSWDRLFWRPDILGDRLAQWILAAEFLLTGAAEGFRHRFLDAVGMQARHLLRTADAAAPGEPQIAAAQGLIAIGLSLPGLDKARQQGCALLDRAVADQVLPDGGHVSRSPSVLLSVLRRLVVTRGLLAGAHEPVPEPLQHAIDRMVPLLRALRLGDGALVRFNGGHEEDASTLDRLITLSGIRARPLNNAAHAGFQRVIANRLILIADLGAPPPPDLDGDAHAGLGSFEFSVGKQRLVVNCGSHREEGSHWHPVLRNSAAHSTLAVGDTNMIALATADTPAGPPPQVRADRQEGEGSTLLTLSHDGYLAAYGLAHKRDLFVSADGADLRGCDQLTGSGVAPFNIRFHLHPSLNVSVIAGGDAVLIKPPKGKGWRFRARGATLEIKDSVYFENGMHPRRTEQIVLIGHTDGQGATVKWAFRTEA
ncbi:MAG: heparinase II/III family protein [Magnetospiraceae bacterium]